MSPEPEAQLQSIREALKLRPDQVNLKSVVPVFVPSSFYANAEWIGPFERLRAGKIGLTWSVLGPNQTMRYVDHAIATYWKTSGVDWKAVALDNLAEHSNQNPATHEFLRADGKVYAIVMMHEDGIGPSRLLLKDRLSRIFLQGYRVAVPEMRCVLAFDRHLEDAEESTLLDVIRHCYQGGTRPLAPGIYLPEDLEALV